MRNYKNQAGCNNCKSVFIKSDYDEGYTYFCTQDGVQRPLCLSVGMNETIDTPNEKRWQRVCANWNEWSKKREVKPFGICDDWQGGK